MAGRKKKVSATAQSAADNKEKELSAGIANVANAAQAQADAESGRVRDKEYFDSMTPVEDNFSSPTQAGAFDTQDRPYNPIESTERANVTPIVDVAHVLKQGGLAGMPNTSDEKGNDVNADNTKVDQGEPLRTNFIDSLYKDYLDEKQEREDFKKKSRAVQTIANISSAITAIADLYSAAKGGRVQKRDFTPSKYVTQEMLKSDNLRYSRINSARAALINALNAGSRQQDSASRAKNADTRAQNAVTNAKRAEYTRIWHEGKLDLEFAKLGLTKEKLEEERERFIEKMAQKEKDRGVKLTVEEIRKEVREYVADQATKRAQAQIAAKERKDNPRKNLNLAGSKDLGLK